MWPGSSDRSRNVIDPLPPRRSSFEEMRRGVAIASETRS